MLQKMSPIKYPGFLYFRRNFGGCAVRVRERADAVGDREMSMDYARDF